MRFKISFGLGLFFLFLSVQSFAQKKIYLKPVIGNGVLLSRYDHSIGKPDFIGINEINSNNKYGTSSLMLEMDLNKKWRISAGYSRERLGWNYHINLPDSEKRDEQNYSMRTGASRSNRLHRIPVVLKRTFISTHNYHVASVNKLSWFDARLFVQGGLSLDFYKPDAFNSAPFPLHISDSRFGDSILVKEEITFLSKKSISVITGVGTEIYIKGKPLFEITFFYNQGLRNLVASDLHYQVNSLSGHTRIIARGSSFGATLGIPIRLKTFKG